MSREKALESIIVLALASLLFYLWSDIIWLIYVSVGLLAIALISKKITVIIGKIWLTFSHWLGMIMNYIILSLIYYLVLFPLALLQRLTGKNQILKKENPDSYFHKRKHLFTSKDIDHLW